MSIISVIIYGKPVADSIKTEIGLRVDALERHGIIPCMAIIRIGMKADDIAYEKRIQVNCESLGINVRLIEIENDISQRELSALIVKLNENKNVHGIMLFRPLPEHINEQEIGRVILPEKDIDCMNPENLSRLFIGDTSAIAPCTPEAVIEMLKYYRYGIEGKKAVIINRSLVIGKPLAMLFLRENATVTICHSRTRDLKSITQDADIVVSGIGKPAYFNRDYFTSSSVIIDVGINVLNGKMCGDVDFYDVEDNVEAVTPVPGGVGTITSMILLRHLVDSAEKL